MKLEDYLHLYLGCDVMLTEPDSAPFEVKLTGVINERTDDEERLRIQVFESDGPEAYEGRGIIWCDDEEVELILRPLSDMTKEEAKEIAAVYTGYTINWVHIKDGQIIFNYYEGDEVQENVFDIGYSNPEGFLYMLSRGFDLFGLIDAGLAIDKAKAEELCPHKSK